MIGHKGIWPINLPWGWMAWSVFFVLTGFLVQPKREKIREFIWGKVIRLYPGYWAAMIICFAVTHCFLPELAVSIKDFLIDLTMLGNYLGCLSVVGVDWTLSINLVYYAFIVIVMLINKKWARKKTFDWLAICWSLVACCISVMQNNGIENRYMKISGILLASSYAHMFLSGIALRRISTRENGWEKWLGVLALTLIEHWLIFNNADFMAFYSIFVGLFLTCALCKTSKGTDVKINRRVILSEPFVFIANISYPLYLVHEYTGFAMIKVLETNGVLNEVILIPVITVTMFVAWVIHRWIEVPIDKALRKAG